MARGYLNRPELTAQKFIPDPFCGEPEARLYRSGDLARYLPDGDIEYLGRIDQQVKIRGYRIELGEVEAMLLRHPSVREAVVLAREDRPGDKHLAAYLVARGDTATLASELRAFLKQRLPEYMIPGVFVVLDALPLTPNGKVDRQACCPSQDEARAQTSDYIAPRTPIEEILWAFGLRSSVSKLVGVVDNFFDLGGHSLLATQVIARVNSVLDVGLALRRLFETPTIAALAAEISVQRTAGQRPRGLVSRGPAGQPACDPAVLRTAAIVVSGTTGRELVAYNLPFAVRLRGCSGR